MPILTNARHERFAQGLAAGKTADEAYQEAGYNKSRSAASRLSTNVNIVARVAELLGKAATKAEVTVETIADMLREDRALAARIGQAGAAVTASVSLGKLYGHFIERQIQDQNVRILSDKPVSDEDWERDYAAPADLGAANGKAVN